MMKKMLDDVLMMKARTSMPGILFSISGEDPVILEPKLAANFSMSKPWAKSKSVFIYKVSHRPPFSSKQNIPRIKIKMIYSIISKF